MYLAKLEEYYLQVLKFDLQKVILKKFCGVKWDSLFQAKTVVAPQNKCDFSYFWSFFVTQCAVSGR